MGETHGRKRTRNFLIRRSPFVILPLVIASLVIGHSLLVDLPSLDHLTQNLTVPSTKILDRRGRLLYEISDPAGMHHTTLSLSELPAALQQATIATEDASFYSNPGVDALGILRAAWINLRGGEIVAGGSTITQQVARNVLLDPHERTQRTLTRKLRESILAWRLARAYSKDDILALYLNQTYYGNLAYGVEAAAQTYFGKSARDLDTAESALLAGLPQAPALYDPLTDPEAAKERQGVVLNLMVKSGYLTPGEARLTENELLRFASAPFPIAAPHFVFYVWNLLEGRYGPDVLYSGLTLTTTLDLDLTHTAEAIITRRLAALEADSHGAPHSASDAALVALEPSTGQILAMVGSPDYFDARISGAINMALAPRQPGSAIKPITYAAAFSPDLCPLTPSSLSPANGGGEGSGVRGECPWTPATMILDVRSSFITKEGHAYVPQNYDRRFHGPVLARQALAASLNVPAVVTLQHVGLDTLLRLAGRLGLTTLSEADRFGLALTLGGGEVRLLDLVAAYAAFDNGGRRVAPVAILEAADAQGNVIERWVPRTGEQVLDPRVAYLITNILSDNQARAATFGLNSVLNIGRPAAVKTGTTTDYHDNWTVGYTPDLAAGAWVGNADNTPMVDISGVSGAGPIWHDFVRAALLGRPERQFTEPPGMTHVDVCALSGLLPTQYCPHRIAEIFLDGSQPNQSDHLFQPFKVDSLTGALADRHTPPERVVDKVFLVLPPEAEDWARQNGIPQPPASNSELQTSNFELQVTSPDPQTVFHLSPLIPKASQRIRLSAVAYTPLAQLTLLLDGTPLIDFTAPPYETWWTLTPGPHSLKAVGTDPSGETHESLLVNFVVNP